MPKKLTSPALKIFSALIAGLISLELLLQVISFGLKITNKESLITKDDENLIRIVTIGESTSAANQFSTQIEAWPSKLQKLLNEHNYPVRVYNLAIPATTTNLILARIQKQINQYHPHIVISMMGINDSSLWLNDQENLLFKNFITLKILKWTWDSVSNKLKHNTKFKSAPSVPLKDFKNFKNTSRIIKLFKNRNSDLAQKLVAENIANFSSTEQAQYYAFLGNSLLPEPGASTSEFLNSYNLYNISHAKYFWVESTIENHSYVLETLGKSDECLKLAKDYIQRNGEVNDFIMMMYGFCSSKTSKDWEKVFQKLPYNLKISYTKSSFETTKQNYRRLHKILNDEKIDLIAMQYPLVEVGILKYYFQDGPDYRIVPSPYDNIHFVSNRENFLNSLKTHSYNELFVDHFAGFFGHTTNLGHDLIAQSAYDKVVEIISKYKLTHPGQQNAH